MPYRICERCGQRHLQANSPICGKCRYTASKRQCPIDGCENIINSAAKTCLKHRPLQWGIAYTHCRGCGIEFERPLRRGVCDWCQRETRVLCVCGCGRYRRKYGKDGQVFEYISGHNDNWAANQRPPKTCVVCGKEFQASSPRTKLCGVECRTKWLTINPPNEKKRVRVECAACGKVIYRILSETKPNRSYACSKRCHYIIVANKLRGPKSDAKRLALHRDGAKCLICGFDVIVHVHHVEPKRNGGADDLNNLITLCPNHHAMADREVISAEELHGYIEGY